MILPDCVIIRDPLADSRKVRGKAMICSYCGAEADLARVYCLVCGTKLVPETKKTPETPSIECKQSIPEKAVVPTPSNAQIKYPKPTRRWWRSLDPRKHGQSLPRI